MQWLLIYLPIKVPRLNLYSRQHLFYYAAWEYVLHFHSLQGIFQSSVALSSLNTLYLEILLMWSPYFWKDDVNTYLEVLTFLCCSRAEDWWRKRFYINQIIDERVRKWFYVASFSAFTETWGKKNDVCIQLFNIYNGKVPTESFGSPGSNLFELGNPQTHLGRWYMSYIES